MSILSAIFLCEYKVAPDRNFGTVKGNLIRGEIEELVLFLIMAIMDNEDVAALPFVRSLESNNAIIVPYAFDLDIIEADAGGAFYPQD